MSCGLEPPHLYILYILYSNYNFTEKTTYHGDKLKFLFNKKFDEREFKFKKIVKKLLNEGYITKLPKKTGDKYYLSDRKLAIYALNQHGINVTCGNRRG